MKFIPQFKVFMAPGIHLALREVFNSGYIGQGPKVDEFESRLKEVLDFDYGVTVNSGTSALQLALHLAGVGPGDKVISTPMNCLAGNMAILHTGADIIWADVDEYGNISPDSVREILSNYTNVYEVKAVMAVDWGGLPCDYDALRAAAGDIPIIEDAAHSFLAEYRGKSVARSAADYKCYSFQAIKHLTTIDGGLLVCPEDQYEKAKLLRWFGLDRTSSDAMRCYQDPDLAGFKYHMNDVNATVGLMNLADAIDNVDTCRETAEIYDDAFADLGIVPAWPEDRKSSFWLYTIHVENPRFFAEWMKNRGIGVSQTHNRNDVVKVFQKYRKPLPNLDSFFSTMTCIPIGWWLGLEDILFITESVKEYVRDRMV